MTEKPRETQAESHVVELKEKVNNSSLMKHRNPDNNSALPGWNSTIVIGEDLFNEIINHPVPIDMNTLKAMKRSSLGLDLYLWVTYRTFALRAPLRLSWRLLYQQFGADPSRQTITTPCNTSGAMSCAS